MGKSLVQVRVMGDGTIIYPSDKVELIDHRGRPWPAQGEGEVRVLADRLADCTCVHKHLADAFNDPKDVNPSCPVHGPRLPPKYEALDPKDIKPGDLIREEYPHPLREGESVLEGFTRVVAIEYRATVRDRTKHVDAASGHFLIERPPSDPVKVRRHDFDWLAAWLRHEDEEGLPTTEVRERVRTLIDNSELRDDHDLL